MAKKEKVLDLNTKASKVTGEELAKLQEVVKSINTFHFEIGKLEAQKHQYLHALSVHGDSIKELQNELETKYGTADVNLTDGSINRTADEG